MSRTRKPVRARSKGSATHNSAQPPEDLEVTIWGETEPDKLGRVRAIAMTLGEEDVRELLQNLNRFDLLPRRP